MNRDNKSCSSKGVCSTLQKLTNTMMRDGILDVQEMERVLNYATDNISLFSVSPIDLVTSISKIAKIAISQHMLYHSELQNFLNAWIRAATPKLNEFDNQQLADSISALAQLNYHNTEFENVWIRTATPKLDEFDNQQLVDSASALAQLNHHNPEFENAWISAVTPKLDEFDNQQLVNSISALAQLNHHDRQFENAWISVTIFRLGAFDSQQLVNSISALDQLYHHDDFTLDRWRIFENLWISIVLRSKLYHFTVQELEISKGALLRLDHADALNAWTNVVENRLNQLDHSNHDRPEAVDVIGAEMTDDFDHTNPEV